MIFIINDNKCGLMKIEWQNICLAAKSCVEESVLPEHICICIESSKWTTHGHGTLNRPVYLEELFPIQTSQINQENSWKFQSVERKVPLKIVILGLVPSNRYFYNQALPQPEHIYLRITYKFNCGSERKYVDHLQGNLAIASWIGST